MIAPAESLPVEPATRTIFVLRDGRSLQAQMDADERRFVERVRARVDASTGL